MCTFSIPVWCIQIPSVYEHIFTCIRMCTFTIAILLDHVLQEKFPIYMYTHCHMSICSQLRSLYVFTQIPCKYVHTFIYIYMCTFRSAIWFNHVLQTKNVWHLCMHMRMHECMPTSLRACKHACLCLNLYYVLQQLSCWNMCFMHISCRHLNVCKSHIRWFWSLHCCAVMCVFDKCLHSITCVYLINVAFYHMCLHCITCVYLISVWLLSHVGI